MISLETKMYQAFKAFCYFKIRHVDIADKSGQNVELLGKTRIAEDFGVLKKTKRRQNGDKN